MEREWYVYEDGDVQGTKRGIEIYRKDPITLWRDSEFRLVEKKLHGRLVSKKYVVIHPLLGRGDFMCVSLEDDGCFVSGSPTEWFEWDDLCVVCRA